MKVTHTLGLVTLLTFSAQSQTNEIRFDVLETAQGTYTNAHITTHTANWVVVLHDNGGAKVFMTNLPASVQKLLGYDPAKAEAQAKAEADKKKRDDADSLERRKYLASLAGPVQTVRLISVIDAFGQCVIATSNGQQRVYMLGLPAGPKTFLMNYAKLKSDIDGYAAKAKRMAAAAARADANAATGASGDPAFVNAVMNQRTVANNMVINANDAADNLSDMKDRLSSMQLEVGDSTSFTAYDTGLVNNGIPSWSAQ